MHIQKKWRASHPATRIAIVMAAVALAVFIAKGVIERASTHRLLVGTYTPSGSLTPNDSLGIYRINYTASSGEWSPLWLAVPAVNPSFGVTGIGGTEYFVSEVDAGSVISYRWDRLRNTLRPTSSVPTHGRAPCYVALRPGGGYMAVANYMSGNISVNALDPASGALLENSAQTFAHQGRGSHAERQEAPHAHWVQWNPQGDKIYAVDLGIDKVMVYPFEVKTGIVGPAKIAFTATPGAGPRHLVFHPILPKAYLLNELNNTVTELSIESDGSLTERESLSTLPENFTAHSQAGHIAIASDGNTLYTSNRGMNSITVFGLTDTGAMSRKQIISSKGDWPRFFLLSQNQKTLFVANRRSNSINIFNINTDGTLVATDKSVFAPQPVYLSELAGAR